MRVLICPDKFAGTIEAVAAAEAIATGWRSVAPSDTLTLRPLSDGGPGFLSVLTEALGGDVVPVAAVDPLGRPVDAHVLRVDDTIYVESAHAAGLHLLTEEERDPKVTSSYGVGLLLASAVAAGVRQVVIGLGGSAVNDAGAGLLSALGVVPRDRTGTALPPGGAALTDVAILDGQPELGRTQLVAATDVDSPLVGPQGASAVFGPQKGASQADVALLDAALARFAQVVERDLPGCPPGLAHRPGAGAAGGLGAAVLALGGRCESGIGLVRRLTRLDAALTEVDLVITGEGSFDTQSLRGKVVAGVARAAQAAGRPCVVLAGRVTVGADEAAAAGVTRAYSLVDHYGSQELAMTRPAEGLTSLGARLAQVWSR